MNDLRVNAERLMARIEALARVGATQGGGVCRLAFTEEDKLGRDLVVSLMRKLELEVTTDQIGNVLGYRKAEIDAPPVLVGSHIDTVRNGGRYDGALGVLAGLEVVAVLNDAGITTHRPLAVAFFSNEEGVRFAPDMMGSMVHQGHLALEEALGMSGIDRVTVRNALERIGYAGHVACPSVKAHAYVELHVEQGPVLEREQASIGAVEGVQGISWTEINIKGVANHAGTTPMHQRRDAGHAAAEITRFARHLATDIGGDQVATVGYVNLTPNLVNVIPGRASMTVDLRNSDARQLRVAERRLKEFAAGVCEGEDLYMAHRSLARYEPVAFSEDIIAMVDRHARALGHDVKRLCSGAGHDAQAFAPNCPTGMIFVPSRGGISHNVDEYTSPSHIEAGANVLLRTLLELSARDCAP